MRRKIKIAVNAFNMVEVALALAVVGLGVTGVMALFPVGFNSTRDAMAENYCADAAEEFLSQISRACKENPETIPNEWEDWIGTNGTSGYIRESVVDPGSSITAGSSVFGDIYNPSTPTQGVYVIQRKTGDIVDFTAHIQVWKAPISNLNVAGQNINFATLPSGHYDYGAMLYITISWPIEKDYEAREKRIYCKEVFRY